MENRVINGRYQVKDPPLGQGGMGIVYRVYDTVTNRYVALKTVEGNVGASALELFDREWSILARLSHPNIIDILDAGVFRDSGEQRPYFVMPLLIGSTLDKLIKAAPNQRMPLQQLVEVVVQACRGLQAAHDQGLVHRDLKPSNIFFTKDKTVKIIDFGVAHLADTRSVTGIKGTLQYMAPEQMEMKAATPLSDVFSLGVVCYEALSGRRPFARNTESAVAEAIRTFVPPSLSEVNPDVNQLVGRTVHKAIAKQPWYRFSSAREFAETLQKAFKNEAIERFDRARIQPRIDRAQKAHDSGDFQFALDILNELASEGHVISGVSLLREQAETALRHRDVQFLLENAKIRLQEEEFPLALQKLQSALELDPKNGEALAMKAEIDSRLSERQVENRFRVAEEYLDQQLFAQARRAVEEILEINASNTQARNLLIRIEQTKQDFERAAAEQDTLFEAARIAFEHGELKNARVQMEQLFESLHHKTVKLDAKRDSQYRELHRRIHDEINRVEQALVDGRRCLDQGDFAGALAICDRQLKSRPSDPAFQALKLEAEDALREQRTAAIAEFIRKAEGEPDLDKKQGTLQEAAALYPDEPYFPQALSMIQNRRSLMHSIIERARRCEEELHFTEAISQWEMLRNIAPQHEGIDGELRRLEERHDEQTREQAKARWIDRFNRYFFNDDYARAKEVIRDALLEFPGDPGLLERKERAKDHAARDAQAKALLERAHNLFAEGKYDAALEALEAVGAWARDSRAIRVSLLSVVLDQARVLLSVDWKMAQPFIDLATGVDGGDPVARNLAAVLQDHERKAEVDQYIAEATTLREGGSPRGALARVEQALLVYPNELRLSQLHNALRSELQVADAAERSAKREPTPRAGRWRQFAAALTAFNKPKPKPSRARLKTFAASAGAQKGFSAPVYGEPSVSQAVLTNPLNDTPSSIDQRVASLTQPSGTPPMAPPKTPSPESQQKRSRRWVWATLCIAGLLMAVGLLYKFLPSRHNPGHPAPRAQASSVVDLQVNVPDATVTIDGQRVAAASVTLAPGVHQAQVAKPGFQSISKTFSVSAARAHQKIAFSLAPFPIELRLATDLPESTLVVDSGNAIDLQNATGDHDLPLGNHQVKLLSANREVLSFSAAITSDQMVRLTGLSKAEPTPSLIVSSLGNSATVYTNSSWKLFLENGTSVAIPPAGLVIPDLTSVHNQIAIGSGRSRVSIAVPSEPSPILTVSLLDSAARAPKGVVLVKANVPDASVFVDNTPLTRPLMNGSKSIALAPGDYAVKVAKTGYGSLAPQRVHVDDGRMQTLSFTMTPIVIKARLQLTGAAPGTLVWIDGNQAGVAQPDGSLAADVQPGSHQIRLQKDGFANTPAIRDFQANQTTTVNAGQLLTQLGTLTIANKPADSGQASVRKDGETQARRIGDTATIWLEPGRYYLSMKADGRPAHQILITIAGGGKSVVNWNSGAEQTAASTPAESMAKTVEDPASWQVGSAGWWTYQGADFGWLRATAGSISVDILKQKTKTLFVARPKKIEFTVDYHDPDNAIEYVLDDRTLRQRRVWHGIRYAEKRIPLDSDTQPTYRIVLQVDTQHVAVFALNGKLLDEVKRGDQLTPLGKIGFRGGVSLVATVTSQP